MNLTRAKSLYDVNQIYISPDDKTRAPITRLSGKIHPQAQSRLILGQICTCVSKDGVLTKIQLEKDYCAPVVNGWYALVEFYRGVAYEVPDKVKLVLSKQLPLDEVLLLYRNPTPRADCFDREVPLAGIIKGEDVYQDRPLPQYFKVESWMRDKVAFVVDESMIFSIGNGEHFRRIRMKNEHGAWVVAAIESASVSDWNSL